MSGEPHEHRPIDPGTPGASLAVGQTLEATRSDSAALDPPSDGGPPDPAETLEVIDPSHYRIAGEFARGGLGRILEAQEQRLGRAVAVKELLVTGQRAVARFIREARLTARLQHPSIVPVHEVGTWPNGTIFYAMKLVRGGTLSEAISAARSFPERLALLPNVLAVAEAVAYAHSERIIHRDLKPANVLIGPFGETVVIDWGLAKELGPTGAETRGDHVSIEQAARAGQTIAGTILGTPEYMAPEQAESKQADERSDVYALGAMLYQVLSGKTPHAGDSNAAVLERVRRGAAVPIDVREPGVPEDLATLVKKAMARDPAARYATAGEFAAELRRYLTGQLVAAHQYGPWCILRR